MWCSDAMPADIAIGDNAEDMGARILGTAPPENGSRFIVMEFAPGIASEMHRTETIDYIVMLSGEIEMDMDDSTVKLRAGDIMVQRGTNHAWVNRGKEPARLAIVLLDAKPLGIGHPRLRGDQVTLRSATTLDPLVHGDARRREGRGERRELRAVAKRRDHRLRLRRPHQRDRVGQPRVHVPAHELRAAAFDQEVRRRRRVHVAGEHDGRLGLVLPFAEQPLSRAGRAVGRAGQHDAAGAVDRFDGCGEPFDFVTDIVAQ